MNMPNLVSQAKGATISLMRAGRGDWVSKSGGRRCASSANFSRGIGIAAR
jgi:L-asparaginase II